MKVLVGIPTKNVIILVVTVTGRGDPTYHISGSLGYSQSALPNDNFTPLEAFRKVWSQLSGRVSNSQCVATFQLKKTTGRLTKSLLMGNIRQYQRSD